MYYWVCARAQTHTPHIAYNLTPQKTALPGEFYCLYFTEEKKQGSEVLSDLPEAAPQKGARIECPTDLRAGASYSTRRCPLSPPSSHHHYTKDEIRRQRASPI